MTEDRNWIIALDDAVKAYGRNVALQAAHLKLFENDTVSLAGGNGSGKSTLLRILAGATILSRGQISRADDWKLLRIGFLPQRGGIYPNLTVGENLVLRARLFGEQLEPQLESNAVVCAFDLFASLDVPISKLSGGTARLCAIASTLCAKPDVLFMDEPLAGLDARHRRDVADYIERIRPSFRLLVTCEHMEDPIFIKSTVIRLVNGRCV